MYYATLLRTFQFEAIHYTATANTQHITDSYCTDEGKCWLVGYTPRSIALKVIGSCTDGRHSLPARGVDGGLAFEARGATRARSVPLAIPVCKISLRCCPAVGCTVCVSPVAGGLIVRVLRILGEAISIASCSAAGVGKNPLDSTTRVGGSRSHG